MKILFLSVRSILELSGGGLESRKIYSSLRHLADKYEDIEFCCISPDPKDNVVIHTLQKKRWKDVMARVFGHSSYLWIDWVSSDLSNQLLSYKPDVLVLGTSRLGFIGKKMKKSLPDVRIVGHFDNVEADYVEGVFAGKTRTKDNLFRYMEKKAVMSDEAAMLENMDTGIFLTARDISRIEELYGQADYKSIIIPICLDETKESLGRDKKTRLQLVFLGSLWYRSNVEAIIWFVENVWREICRRFDNIELIIGGNRPVPELVEYLKAFSGIHLHPNFSRKGDIVSRDAIFISPIQTGSGMKVKIAEALQLGLRVVASPESMVGYEEVLNDPDATEIIIQATKPEEYFDAILLLSEQKVSVEIISEKSKKLYNKYYSMKRAYQEIEAMFNK
jgi:glycosyltransferase involved in cell wall biosynthesis